MKKLVASDMSLATSWHERSKSIFRPALNGPSGPRRVCAVQAFWPKAKTLAQGEFISPEHWNQNGWSDQRERNPKRKTRLWRVFLFGTPEGTRTPSLQNRNLTLYPIALQARTKHLFKCLIIIATFSGFVKRYFCKKQVSVRDKYW